MGNWVYLGSPSTESRRRLGHLVVLHPQPPSALPHGLTLAGEQCPCLAMALGTDPAVVLSLSGPSLLQGLILPLLVSDDLPCA